MTLIDVKWNTYIDSYKKNNNEDSEFKVDDHVKISTYKNIFAKDYIPNWSEEVLVGKFHEEELQEEKRKKKEKSLGKKKINYMSNGKMIQLT